MKFRILLVLFVLLTFALPALAQEATAEPGVELTPEPPVVVIPPVVDSGSADLFQSAVTFGALILVAIVVGLMTRSWDRSAAILDRALSEKRILDEGERRYMESSMEAKQFVNVLAGFVEVLSNANVVGVDAVIDVLNKRLKQVTDGLPNEDVPPTFKRPQ